MKFSFQKLALWAGAALAGGLYAAVFRSFTTQYIQPEESLRIVATYGMSVRMRRVTVGVVPPAT